LAPLAGDEAELVRIGQLLAVKVREQDLLGRVIVNIFARIDMAVPGPMLQRDSPLPAGITGRCSRVRRQWRDPSARDGHCAIARKPMRPILITGLQGLLDEQPAEARAIDEEIRLDQALALQRHTRDVPNFTLLAAR